MNPILWILYLFSTCSILTEARIHQLVIQVGKFFHFYLYKWMNDSKYPTFHLQDDDRRYIRLMSFGFYAHGFLQINFTNFKFSSSLPSDPVVRIQLQTISLNWIYYSCGITFSLGSRWRKCKTVRLIHTWKVTERHVYWMMIQNLSVEMRTSHFSSWISQKICNFESFSRFFSRKDFFLFLIFSGCVLTVVQNPEWQDCIFTVKCQILHSQILVFPAKKHHKTRKLVIKFT